MSDIESTVRVRFTGEAQGLVNAFKQGESSMAGFTDKATAAGSAASRSLDTGTLSAKQMAASLRGVPAQFTDIFVSLQGGQAPLTVFLQQGGQLKDMFGGPLPAAKALTQYIAGLVTPLTVAAGAVAVLGYAWYQGTQEAQAYNKAIILTGNNAGKTAGQLADMARELGNSGQVQSDAAAAIAELAGSGAVAGDQLKKLAGIALDTEKATGQSITKTAEIYKELEKAPLQASIKLNDQVHHLTLTTYEHIRSLDQQGRSAEAGAVAMNAYADVMAERNKQMIANNGYLVTSWNGVTKAVKEAMSWLMNVGRDQTGSEQLAALKASRARIEGEKWKYEGGGESGKNAYEKAIQQLDRQITYIERVNGAMATTTAEQAKQNKLLELKTAWDAQGLELASKQDKMKKELTKAEIDIKALVDAKIINEEQAAIRLNAIRDKYKDKGTSTPKVDPFAGVLKSINERTAAYKLELEQGDKLTEGQKAAIKILADVTGGTLKLTEAKAILLGKGLEEMLQSEQLTLVRAAELKATQDATQERQRYLDTTVKQTQALQDDIRQQQDHNATIGMSEAAIAALTAQRERDKATTLEAMAIKRLDRNLDYQEYETTMALVAAMQTLANEKARGGVLETANAELKKSQVEWTKFYDSIYNGLTDNLYRAFEKGSSFFKSFWDGIQNTLKTTVLKVGIQGAVTGITGGLGLGAANAAGVGGNSNGLLGSLSNLSSAKSLYDAINVGYASTVGNGVSALFGTTAGNAAIGTAVTGSASSAAAAATAAAEAAGATSAAASSAAAIGSTIAAAVPYVAAAVAVASLWDNAFGMGEKQTTATGLRGTLSASGANVNNFNTWSQKGGWFRDDASGEDVTAVSSQMQQFLDAAVGQTTAATQAYATAIGLSADTVNSYTQAINLNLDGLDEAGKQEAINKALGGFADGMAGVYGGVFRLRKEGEGASTTLARLSTSLATTNGWFAKVDQTLLAVSVSGADAASQLADNFGGLDKLSSSLQSYYDNYFSDAERAATSTAQISKALADVNVAMPKSKEQFRAIASSLDLNTAAGRKAYATLLTLAPEFATVAEQTSKAASETANQLLKTFSGRGRLLPLLSQTVAGVDDLNGALATSVSQALDMGNAAGWISTRLGDSTSDLLFFSDQVGALNQPLSSSQLAAAALTEQISDLQLMASGAEIDFAALNAALADVDTETFMNVMEGVLNKVAALFEGVLGDISSERIAVRDAALQILGPQVLTKDQIQRGIDGVNAGALPSNSDLVAAQAGLAAVDKLVADNEAAMAAARKTQPGTAALDSSAAAVSAATAKVANAQTLVDQFRAYGNESFNYFMDQAYAGNDLRGTVPNPSGERNAQQVVFDLVDAKAALEQPTADYQAQLNAYNTAQAAFEATLVPLQAYAATLASVNLPAALSAVQDAQSTYVEGLQDYAIDAGKATQKLSKLREETVKYYDQQKALADLMAKSAAGLRSTVADYRYNELTPEQQFAQLQGQFSTAYSMALSTGGDTLAGYGDQLNGLLAPLLEKAREVYSTDSGYNAFAATALARAEAVAARLDTLTPTDYAADSLDMLASIDATLAVLDESSKSAEKIISEAINAGSEKTAAGLRALIAAVTGQSVPAFAAGGDFSGGWRVVGEDGPELEATGPSRIFNASQTRSILSGGAGGGGSTGNTARLEALVQALTLEVSNQRFELRAIAVNTAGTERILKRVTPDGESLQTTVAA